VRIPYLDDSALLGLALHPRKPHGGTEARYDREETVTVRLLPTLLLLSCSLVAQELPAGTVIPSVACRAKPQISYALYLPSSYTAQRTWPILYCLDPGARGRIPVERFAAAAERAGFIVVGSNNSRNGPLEPVREAVEQMVSDTHERFAIDETHLYAAGFSGGSRLALGWGLGGHLAGVIACGAGFGPNGVPKQIPFQLYMAAGVDDFNHDELWEVSLTLAKRGTPHRFVVFEGSHEWLPANLAMEALDFFAGRVPPNSAADSKTERKQIDKFNFLSQQASTLEGIDRRALFERLHKEAAKPDDSPDRRVARRILGGALVRAMEEGRPAMEARNYKLAAGLFEIATIARPEAAEVWYALATAQAGAGNKADALKALRQSVIKGFKDRERLDHEPLFDKLREDSRFLAVSDSIQR
jgi:predicted esterase